jgi:thiamine biosynthesis lipoprotein
MGTACEVTVVGGDTTHVALARGRVEELEARWSRFRPDSEISRLNRRAGQPTALTFDSYLLVDHAIAGWRWTSGRYDPTVLSAIEAAGYDRSFELVTAGPPGAARQQASSGQPSGSWPGPTPGCAGIELDPLLRAVTLPPGVGFDPGGIGKGLAADLVVDLLLADGARGACVSLGGDGRMAGEPPAGGWRVGIGSPYNDDELLVVVELTDHGIATSSRLTRRWSAGGEERHHLLDPRSGYSIDNGLDTVTVIADDAWVAEILAKAAFVAGADDGAGFLTALGVGGLLVESLERVRIAGVFASFVVAPGSAA